MTDEIPIEIHVNGEPEPVDAGSSVADLIASKGLGERPVAVEVNREIVPRARHGETRFRPGDRVEIVTLVGGG